MATVTEPIMTDATGQEIVDKLGELASAVKPNASDIPLTPPSGMTATNVQAGISELKQSLSDFETLEKTASGAIATFDDGSDLPMPSLKVAIEPQQDLHGYDSPWVGGAGKNKLEFSLTSCKSITQNRGATWSGNVLSHANVNFSVEEDGVVNTNGTASSNAILRYAYITPSVSGDYIINGLPQKGGYNTFEIMLVNDTFSSLVEHNLETSGTTVTLTAGTTYGIQIIIRNGYNSNGLTFKPMIRLASVTDATFAPYSNICPISGWDEVNVTRYGKNLITSITEGIELYSANGTTNANSDWYVIDYVRIEYGKTYYLSGTSSATVCYYDKTKTFTRRSLSSRTITPQEGEYYVRCNSSISGYSEPQIEEGDEATSFSPIGQTYNIEFKDGSNPLTVYGGTLDVVSGVLTITDGYIASYNGETLPSTWISDRDVYAEGTTPTIGAEVVYKLATPQTIQLTPTQVKSLLGQNNVWADTGNIELTYLTNNPLTQTVYDMVKILVEQST